MTEDTTTQEPEEESIPDGATFEQLEALGTDTPEDEIHSRKMTNRAGQPVMRDGKQVELDYVTARFVQDRLDQTVGPARWQSVFSDPLPTGAVRCGVGILVQRGGAAEWVWKWDVGIPSTIEPDKGAHSDAFKRAGVQWGIARDLYDERDADREVQPVAAQTGYADSPPAPVAQTITQQVEGQNGVPVAAQGTAQGWVCPIHGTVKYIEPGVSKRTGRAYSAFYGCTLVECDQKSPRGLVAVPLG